MNIKKIKNIDVILVEYRWILTFNLTDLMKNLEGMILGLFVTKMVWLWFQVIGGNLEGNRCVASTNTRVDFVSTILAVLSCLVEARARDHLISYIVWQAMKKA